MYPPSEAELYVLVLQGPGVQRQSRCYCPNVCHDSHQTLVSSFTYLTYCHRQVMNIRKSRQTGRQRKPATCHKTTSNHWCVSDSFTTTLVHRPFSRSEPLSECLHSWFPKVMARTGAIRHAKLQSNCLHHSFFHYGPANGSLHRHFIWSPSLFCGWTTNLEWITTWATAVQHTSMFQVSLGRHTTSAITWTISTSLSSRASDCIFMMKLARAK